MYKATLVVSNHVVFNGLRVKLGNQLLVQSQKEQENTDTFPDSIISLAV